MIGYQMAWLRKLQVSTKKHKALEKTNADAAKTTSVQTNQSQMAPKKNKRQQSNAQLESDMQHFRQYKQSGPPNLDALFQQVSQSLGQHDSEKDSSPS